jgi:hypothetical protein
MLPVVRTIRFDPPGGGQSAVAAIEDYAIACTSQREARSLADALAPLWLYRASRAPVPPVLTAATPPVLGGSTP